MPWLSGIWHPKEACKLVAVVCTRVGVTEAQGMPGRQYKKVKAFAESRLYKRPTYIDGFLRMPSVWARPSGHALPTVVHTAVTMFADILGGCHIPGA